MKQHIALTTLIVKDYNEAINFYVNKLGFVLVEDTLLSDGREDDHGVEDDHDKANCHEKRWVIVSPEGSQTQLLLARAITPAEVSAVGNQSGGRVFLFLHTDDFWRDYRAYLSRGVEFVRGEPRVEPYGTVAVFSDLYGNLWDLIERV